MHFTLREIMRFRAPVMIWFAVTAVAAVAGPFGTLEVMGAGARTVYWGGFAAVSIGLNFGAIHLARDRGLAGALVVWAGFVLLVSGAVHLVNSVLFSGWGGVADWAYLTGIVALVTVAVHLVIWAVIPRAAVEVPKRDAFLRRLPIEVRAPLVRIEAQDHYLNVVTVRGKTMILMRLGDAIAELSGQGLQVHRSHWVAQQAITQHRREGARDVLVMSDGADVPVSRSFRSAAQEAGLF